MRLGVGKVRCGVGECKKRGGKNVYESFKKRERLLAVVTEKICLAVKEIDGESNKGNY